MPLLPKRQDARRSFGQRDRRVRSAVLTWADTHSVLSCTRKGSSPEMAGSGKLLLRLSVAPNMPPKWLPIRRWQHIIESDSACSLVLEQAPGRLPGKNGRLGPTEPGSAHGQTQMQKKKKLGPTDRQTGSVHVTMTPPRHADKDCFTTEETVTISSSRITRQGRCRSGAAESSLVARNNQQTNGRSPQRTTVDTRRKNSRMVESSGKRDR